MGVKWLSMYWPIQEQMDLPSSILTLQSSYAVTDRQRIANQSHQSIQPTYLDPAIQIIRSNYPNRLGQAARSPISDPAAKQYIQKNLDKGFMMLSHVPFALPILMVQKHNRALRLCIDYWKVECNHKEELIAPT